MEKYFVLRNWAEAAVYQCQFEFGDLAVTLDKASEEKERSGRCICVLTRKLLVYGERERSGTPTSGEKLLTEDP